MQNKHSNCGKYLLAALLGASAGGLLVAVSTRAVPRMMSGMAAGMMQHIMPAMKASCCEEGDTCKRMMAGMQQLSEQATCHTHASAKI